MLCMHSIHYVKIIQIQGFSGPHFPTFGLNMEIYSVNLRTQSKFGKIRTRKTTYLDSFYAVIKITFDYYSKKMFS